MGGLSDVHVVRRDDVAPIDLPGGSWSRVLLTEERPDPRLLRRWPLEEALRHRALPLRLRKDGTLDRKSVV